MFKNMKIRKSLILGFGTLLICALAISITTLTLMNVQRSTFVGILNNQVKANELVQQCNLDISTAATHVREVVLIPDDPDMETKASEATQLLQEINDNLEELKKVYTLNDGKLDEYIAAVNDWSQMVPDILTAVNEGKIDDATALIRDECSPRLDTLMSLGEEIGASLSSVQANAITQQQTTGMVVMIVIIVVLVIITLLIIFMVTKLIRSIIRPIDQVHAALEGFSQGNLEVAVEYESKNELGEMCDSLRTSQHVLSSTIQDICYLLDEMASGNFNVRSRDTSVYVGSLSKVLEAVRTINFKLSDTLGQIALSAEQVAAGADQVSTGAQSLAQGATEQASAVEREAESVSQVTEGIDQISSVVQTNSATSEESAAASEELSGQAALMKELLGRFTLRSTEDNGDSSCASGSPASQGVSGGSDYASYEDNDSSFDSGSSSFSNNFSKY
jgi:methyl-accepting chemotaxis protein